MSRHSNVFIVLLVALAAITIVHCGKRKKCQGKVSKGHWGGVCFGTDKTLKDANRKTCDVLVEDAPGCKDEETCCVQCNKQDYLCENRYGAVSRSPECCNKLGLRIGRQLRRGSGCWCCKQCKRKRWCKKHNGKCITKDDPVYNMGWCNAKPGWIIRKRACSGYGCWCCANPNN